MEHPAGYTNTHRLILSVTIVSRDSGAFNIYEGEGEKKGKKREEKKKLLAFGQAMRKMPRIARPFRHFPALDSAALR